MAASHFPVAVIGAGLGGLTLARVLHVNGLEAAVFDLEDSAEARVQGGMLDIHHDSGQVAVRAAGLYEEFRALIHPGGQELRLVDKHGTVRLSAEDDGEGGRPEVDRGQLRDLLLSSLPEGVIRWGKRASAARRLDDGRYQVTFADGSEITADLLIGADGAWSRIRGLLSGATPAYTGISFVETDLVDPDTRHSDCAALVGGGFFICLGDSNGFFAHKETDGSLHAYTAVQADEDWLDGIDFSDDAGAKAAVLAEFEGWADPLRALVAEADGPVVPRKIYALPVGHRWPRIPGVTLLGDAAHLMSPFAGEGANLAMLDGAELGRALAAHPGDTEAALAAYEQELFPRSAASAGMTADSMEMMFGDNGIDRLVKHFTEQRGLGEG